MQKQFIEYQHNGVLLEGCLFAHEGEERPTVLLYPTVAGRNEQFMEFAERFYHMGYNSFAADMYGRDMLTAEPEQCYEYMNFLRRDRQLLQDRVNLILDTLKSLSVVKQDQIAATGYCFGGLCVLDLARSGAELQAVVSVHGLLKKDEHIATVKQIIPQVLVLHGTDDPLAPMDDVVTFKHEMNTANANWEMHLYGQVAHAFTNPKADTPERGIMYNQQADTRSWIAVEAFLNEIFIS